MQISEYSQPVKPFDYQPPVPMQLMMSVMDSKSRVMSDNLRPHDVDGADTEQGTIHQKHHG